MFMKMIGNHRKCLLCPYHFQKSNDTCEPYIHELFYFLMVTLVPDYKMSNETGWCVVLVVSEKETLCSWCCGCARSHQLDNELCLCHWSEIISLIKRWIKTVSVDRQVTFYLSPSPDTTKFILHACYMHFIKKGQSTGSGLVQNPCSALLLSQYLGEIVVQ